MRGEEACCACGKKVFMPIRERDPNPDCWVMMWVTWNKQIATLCRQCYDEVRA
jgi:hypothetical protein